MKLTNAELDEKILQLAVERGLITPGQLQQADLERTVELSSLVPKDWSPRTRALMENGLLSLQILNQLKAEIISASPEVLPTSVAPPVEMTVAEPALMDVESQDLSGRNLGRYQNLQFLGAGGIASASASTRPRRSGSATP